MAEIPEDTYLPTMKPSSDGQSVLIMTADNTEDLEFFYPFYRFIEAGCKVDVVTPKGGKFEAKHGLGLKDTKIIEEAQCSNYDMLYIPGGKAPEKLKGEKAAISLVKEFVSSGKPIAAICHGPQVLAKAGVITGKNIAAWPEIEDEVTEAGAEYMDQPTVVDGQFITARWPADLPSHMAKTLEILMKSSRSQNAANKNASDTQQAARSA